MNTFCTYYNQGICQSCSIISTTYLDQIRNKESILQKSFLPVQLTLESTIISTQQGFRNKAKLIVTGTVVNPIIGLYGENNLDNGREILNCPLHNPFINKILNTVKEFITHARIEPYSVSNKKGELKGLILFTSPDNSQNYLRFILRSKESLDRVRKFHQYLLDKIPNLECISVNIQPIAHAILEGDEEIYITKINSIKLNKINYSPEAFIQTNQEVAQLLYQRAASWIESLKINKMLELYCGQGAFSFYFAKHVQHGLGIEISSKAITMALQTARELDISNINFISADAQDVQKEALAFGPDALLVNPPRRGLGKSLPLILDLKCKYIIYSSCSYQTLSQDFKELSKYYEIKKIQIFDMFPHTEHFETLVLLFLKESNSLI